MDRGLASSPDLRALLAATRDQNPRARFWSHVCRIYPLDELSSSERLSLVKLSEGHEWMSNISDEQRAEYDRSYDRAVTRSSPFAAAVHKDITRTFGLFAAELRAMGTRRPAPGVNEAALEQLLLATSLECEYCQGMNFVGATLVLEEYSVRDAFAIFMFAMKERHLNVLYSSHSSSLPDYISIYDKLLRQYNPKVHQHFHSIGFLPIMYAIEWFTTLFSVSAPKRLTMYLFDLFLAGFDDIMIRVGLAVVQVLEHEVLKRSAEELQMEFKLLVRKLRPAQVFPLALAYKVHPTLDVLATIYRRMSFPRSSDVEQQNELPIEFEVEEALSTRDVNGKLIQAIVPPVLVEMLGKVEYCVFNCETHAHTASCAFSEVSEMHESARSYSLPGPYMEAGNARKSTLKGLFKNLFEDIPTKKDLPRARSQPVMSMVDSVRVLDPETKMFCPKRDGWLPPMIHDWFATDSKQIVVHASDATVDADSEVGCRDTEVSTTSTAEAADQAVLQGEDQQNSQTHDVHTPVEEDHQLFSEKQQTITPAVSIVGCE